MAARCRPLPACTTTGRLPGEFWLGAARTAAKAEGKTAEFHSTRYFGLIRNFLRYGWLVPYLFGASPAICQSFLQGRKSDLQELVPGTLYGPYATSLRMSDLGYQNRAQDQPACELQFAAEYTDGAGGRHPHARSVLPAIGVREGATGSSSTPTCCRSRTSFMPPCAPNASAADRPAKALRQQGVEYVEMRLFDLNPMVDIGITPEQGTLPTCCC
jgi:glutamate--cysteine ligase